MPAKAVALYVATLAVTHLFRGWRWKYLLRPIGVSLPLHRLLLISSVGFMAILALPVRLGEFVRPYFVVRDGQSRMSAVLGTVAVERIIDGLVISVLFFITYVASAPSTYAPVLRFAVFLSLAGFVTLTLFLIFALVGPDATIRFALTASLVSFLAPATAAKLADRLQALIQGFRVLGDVKNLLPFLVQTILYWGSNGFGMWLLARDMGLNISIAAAYATMALTGVLISLPNSPGLVGQFQLGILQGLHAYLPATVVGSLGSAYAIALHGIQFAWFVGVGLVSLRFSIGTRSLQAVVLESNQAAAESGTRE